MSKLRTGVFCLGTQQYMREKTAISFMLLLAAFWCVAGANMVSAQPVAGYPPDADFSKGDDAELLQPLFVSSVPRVVKETGEVSYDTSVYTFSDIVVFSYFDDTQIAITRASDGIEVYSGTLAANTYIDAHK